jgi:hypothetical protein
VTGGIAIVRENVASKLELNRSGGRVKNINPPVRASSIMRVVSNDSVRVSQKK